MTNQKREVVITGVALSTPLGNDPLEVYRGWLDSKMNFAPIRTFNVENTPVQYAGYCADPDTSSLPDRKVQKILRRKDLLSLLTTIRAAVDSGLKSSGYPPERMGMYVGASATQIGDLTPYFTLVAECADLVHGQFDSDRFGKDMLNLVNPLVVLQTLMNNALCFGTMTLDLRGVNSNFMDFQVSGLRAIGEAYASIRDGRADLALAGGVAGPIEPFQLAEGVQVNYLADTSKIQDGVNKVIRPWDKSRLGTILSEGTGFLVLEEKKSALKRGAKIYGAVRGFGVGSDGHLALFAPAPATGLENAMSKCLKDAQISPDEIAGVIGHGNGSKIHDWSEIRAYQKFFRNRKHPIIVSSPITSIGDMCEASGACATILALISLSQHLLPATSNHQAFEEKLEHIQVNTRPLEMDKSLMMVTSRNFFGLGCALLLGIEAS